MTAHDTFHGGGPASPGAAIRGSRTPWVIVTALLMAAVFVEAAFAGALLSGAGWARPAHRASATLLTLSTLVAGLTAIVSLRRIPRGMRLGLTLLGMAVAMFVQAALGVMTAKGANLLWVHVPLGVALVGLAGQAFAVARRLGD
jgi:hypothetical protein